MEKEQQPKEEVEEQPTCYEDLACCAVCGEGDWEDDNAIIFCDSCDLAVHQAPRQRHCRAW